MQVGIGADQLFILTRRERDGRRQEGGLVLGLRGGYVFAPVRGDWLLETTRLAGGPNVGMTGPYVHVEIGGGGKNWGR